jgi:hypothetical protein
MRGMHASSRRDGRVTSDYDQWLMLYFVHEFHTTISSFFGVVICFVTSTRKHWRVYMILHPNIKRLNC